MFWTLYFFVTLFSNESFQSPAVSSTPDDDDGLVHFNITPVFDESFYELNTDDWKIVKCEIVDAVVTWLNKALRVDNQSTHSLPYNRPCPHGYFSSSSRPPPHHNRSCLYSCSSRAKCGPVTIPQDHLKPCSACNLQGSCWTNQSSPTPDDRYFMESHYVLYVSALSNTLECKAGAVLHGETCVQDWYTDRPTAGYLNFCPDHCDGRHYYQIMLGFVLQEVVSMLGFSKSLMPFFRDENGKPLMPRGKDGLPRRSANGEYRVDYLISKTIVYPDWINARPVTEHSVRVITLPNVLLHASHHFGCPNMTGMPLEDYHSSSKILWESRLLLGEVMTFPSWGYTKPILSSITLAFLQDTGWYYPLYRYGFAFHWGKDLGCGFVYQSCLSYAEQARALGKRPLPYCMPGKRQAVKGCSTDHTHLYTCSFTNYTYKLPRENIYWKSSNVLGGNLPSADYCPIFNSLSDHKVLCTKKTGRKFPEGTIDRISDSAKCIETSQPWKILNTKTNERYREEDWGAGCYKIFCNDTGFDVVIGSNRVHCNETGQLVYVRTFADDLRYTGEIICPSYDSVCLLHKCRYNCKNGAQCYEKNPKKCYCTPGKYGKICIFNMITDKGGKHICTIDEHQWESRDTPTWFLDPT